MKSCWICKHLDFSIGEEDWSELTPGNPPEVNCTVTERGKWHRNVLFDFYDHDCKRRAIEIAEKCEQFVTVNEEKK